MHTLTDYLKTEHEDGDLWLIRTETAVSNGRWTEALSAYCEFHDAHTRHIEFEEDVLFPELDQLPNMVQGPTDMMRREHVQMRRLWSAMHDALLDNDRDRFYEQADLFRIMNHQHNQKEEHILYPMADKLLGSKSVELLKTARHLACSCGSPALVDVTARAS